MTHHAERSALDQFMIFFNRHVHGEKAAECDDGPPAQKQSSDKEHHAGEDKASLMRQCRRRPMFRHINPRRHTHHDYEPHDEQRTAILLHPGATARAARDRQQQLKLARCPHSLAPTLVALPSISAIPSSIPGLKAWPLLRIRCSPIRFHWSPESEIR